ncbi:YqgE/AlgH family protein [Candidatus Comchoanobacter bicostacola]|uniref:YqgE/AlgH family protein n=1 Tax=Candidatus Comchoanobacter bicostacola TaxID=2919598 RepID=A0ABY5DLR0_9GAMM|nr:YqgE/AlgH family protein [Candidatus Comchoanobacter bicostacola]UTC24574.1 YqgE/AlgH family protein [Candidatus Comchoanobacter bicostacola]
MARLFKLEDSFLVATEYVATEALQDALVLLYQRQDGMISGAVINKPDNRKVKDYLAHPKLLSNHPVWFGGPLSPDRLIAISHSKQGLFVTDRLVNLTQEHLSSCLIVAGQCVWREEVLQEQIEQGAWLVVANNHLPLDVPASNRISHVMQHAGWSRSRYVPRLSTAESI